ncbi:hypothetical protein P3875_09100 [Myroides sp. JBRI-B21084]|uniref:hypothetical protein n=1 Tax=Myroides sp. JBRI-B21084 TaxID=3119977 RepID=UPI0026E45BD6|nr:hypothetical protein [Paenimyroides cloacae]WKW45934.1 hypothetical protein P3875_09100 [Paenimyroides cloacae]
MKNIIYVVFLLVTINGFAQSSIEQDALYLKYEQAYLQLGSSNIAQQYEAATSNFYEKFDDYKVSNKFKGANDKERWLSKNASKTKFANETEALAAYKTMVSLNETMQQTNNSIQAIRSELLNKYDSKIVWETLQRRVKENR